MFLQESSPIAFSNFVGCSSHALIVLSPPDFGSFPEIGVQLSSDERSNRGASDQSVNSRMRSPLLARYSHVGQFRESCVHNRDVAGEASTAARASGAVERRNDHDSECRDFQRERILIFFGTSLFGKHSCVQSLIIAMMIPMTPVAAIPNSHLKKLDSFCEISFETQSLVAISLIRCCWDEF